MPALADAAVLRDVLRCPACHALLTVTVETVACANCRHEWRRSAPGYLDLRSPGWNASANGWQDRQDDTCAYYERLRNDPAQAREAFRCDLTPFAAALATHAGRVLDVGGGNGLVRTFMPAAVGYVSVDPSVDWLSGDWDAVADVFSCLNEPLTFVQAFAEHLPFADSAFDSAVCLWTLNHCADPRAALGQLARVVRPDGRLLLVLEDGEPTWSELASGVGEHYLIETRTRLMLTKAAKPLTGWPVQADHVAINNAALARWTAASFQLRRRWWTGCYLALEYERRPTAGSG